MELPCSSFIAMVVGEPPKMPARSGLMDEHEDRYSQAVYTVQYSDNIPRSFKKFNRYRDRQTLPIILSKLYYAKVRSSQASFGSKKIELSYTAQSVLLLTHASKHFMNIN